MPSINSRAWKQSINNVYQRCVRDLDLILKKHSPKYFNIDVYGIREVSNLTSFNSITFYYYRVQRSQNSFEYKVNIETMHCYVYKRYHLLTSRGKK